MRKSLLALLFLTVGGLAQAEELLKAGHPQSYTVVQGDTLWDISGKFLAKPWRWPEIWQANPQINNPHLIFPGDQLYLVYVDGKPRLTMNRGDSRGTIKMSPQVRSKPMADAIPTIPLDVINSWLIDNRIIDSEQAFAEAPYVVAGQRERVVVGAGDRLFARGTFGDTPVYGVYRQARTYTDPVTGEFLGINANSVGTVEVGAAEGDVTALFATTSSEEIRRGDSLFPSEERPINSTFLPSSPEQPIDGLIIDVPRGVTMVGKMDVVTLNKGARDGLVEGNVLAIYQTGETVRDVRSGEMVKIPDEPGGLLMVFRVYDKTSYALVLAANRDLRLQDRVANPW
jgi:nucleoid-associated protein YgaU